MGLVISHNAYKGSVTSFNNFRAAVARSMGIENLQDMEYYKLTGGEKWDDYMDDPLTALMIHSDHEGVLRVQELQGIARRLEETIPDMAKISPEKTKQEYIDEFTVANTAEQFLKGVKLAIKNNEMIRFRGN